ncbi:uncharacterized protein LOC111258776 isoform X3 [Varroa jacobsoni]|uniref:uncharacterized protein LOC111258776 isoform X3 n=1 Tax=Varroa jacobsoni TaxID=62625 RepID=UPI000BF93FF3|nr:uncharacterized protein LOC111258776 isoform X3 [Varroa jacobsoni]
MPPGNRRALRSVENKLSDPDIHYLNTGSRRTGAPDDSNDTKKKTPVRRSYRNSVSRLQNQHARHTAFIDSPACNFARTADGDNSEFVIPLPPSAKSRRQLNCRLRHSPSPFIEPPSFELLLAPSSLERRKGPRESTPADSIRGDTLQSLTRQGSFDAESSHPNSTLPTVSSSYGFVNTVDHVFLDDEDDSLPHAYSTFFETSTLDSNRGCNLLKPKFIEPTNFFPGDDIDEDVPWIALNRSSSITDGRLGWGAISSFAILFSNFANQSSQLEAWLYAPQVFHTAGQLLDLGKEERSVVHMAEGKVKMAAWLD